MDRLEAVAVFVAVTEQGSFAAAARRLGRTPAAVTRAIAELEEGLSTQLFNRTTRSVALTEAGMVYLTRARTLLAAHAEFEGAAPEETEPSGLLRITAPINFGRQHLMPLLNRFLEKHPQIDAQVMLLDRVVSLVEEGLDVGVRLGKPRDTSLRVTWAGAVKLAIYANPAYLAEHGTPATPSELLKHSTISCGTFNPIPERWPIKGPDGMTHISVKPRLVVSSTESAAAAAAAGLGIISLVSYQAAPHVKAGRLVEILPECTVHGVPINIVQPPGRYIPAKVRAFIDEIGTGLRTEFGELLQES
ncbi:DNA-binding transcriptional LysR family regulator [Inquilinus ginsengisoli]|uniref:DNA-binding transcriptional LysR family regulator n=1 Tax=Inquilinus ginsengisoli TaxID=363840 RepID=A0ABU1JS49_9PROT|nr:LysR family transcriptional regulator [Inquilinus ginsengisoli]MDR6291444.1 DNA-binding transcriptional LysR family regulator [Inquilinus ginsengisoli]